MKPLVCALALASGCVEPVSDALPDDPGPPIQMIRTRTMAGELPVVGIDSDRAGGLWIAYQKQVGDYYRSDVILLAHVDARGKKTAELDVSDSHADVLGIAFDGHAVWLNVRNATSAAPAHVRAIDVTTGRETIRFDVEDGISDLEVDDARGELVLSSELDRVIALDLAGGGERWRDQLRPEQPHMYGEQSALALTDTGQMWLASRFWSVLELRDRARTPIATYTEDITDDHHTSNYRLFLAWDRTRQQVIAAAENQISWLAIRGGTP